uniref:Uncharacterized protein LOC113793723 n=1 Tax=Dermatophagoides pteronyssinus TaxID=6956 RepID=A0A6P6Y2U8_DERPT|nr:uncharacterized protein LOC113793723 [Dermatophagoides pteronyssinus]
MLNLSFTLTYIPVYNCVLAKRCFRTICLLACDWLIAISVNVLITSIVMWRNKEGADRHCCPKRYELPYCLLSHVDYHLTKDQLCEMVTGPTFLVRHRMRNGNVGVSGNDHEATIRIIGDYCHMEVSGGQSYYHPFIDMGDSNTDTEGTIVSKNGAFNWSLLGTTGSTSIYYCFPHYGMFGSCDDPNVYERQNRRVYINRDGSATCFSTTVDLYFDIDTMPYTYDLHS